jgi:hypothetical protein
VTFELSLVLPLQSLLEQAELREGRFWALNLVHAANLPSVAFLWDNEEAGDGIEIDALRKVVESIGGMLWPAVRHSGPDGDTVWASGTKVAGTGCNVRALDEFCFAVSQELILEVTINEKRLAAIKRSIKRNA